MGSRSFGRLFALFVVGLSIVSSGCGGGSSSSSSTTQLRVVQASPSQADVNVLVDGNSVATVSYGAASNLIAVNSGSRHVQIEPSGSGTAFIDTNITFNSGDSKTLIVANTSPNVSALTFTNQNTAPTTGDFAIRTINASPTMGAVDVYVVTAGTDINTVTPSTSGLAFGSATSYQSLAAGNYQVFLTLPGSKFVLVNTGTISLISGQVRTVVALNTAGSGFTALALADLN